MWKRLSALWVVVKGDLKLLWFALQHPQSPAWLKLGVVGLGLYFLMPVDIIPDVIPGLGMVDDLVIIPLAVRWLLKKLPAHVREEAERRAAGGTAGKGPAAAADVIDEVR